MKLIKQNATTLHEAYQERKAEYEALRAAGRWPGAVLYSGTLLELALKLVMSKLFGIPNLPAIFQVHDLNLLLHCSGQFNQISSDKTLRENFAFINENWSMAIRYEGAIKSKEESDEFDEALFAHSGGLIPYLSRYF